MCRGHATMGAALWLSGCAMAEVAGGHPGAAAIVVGAAVCAGAALLPDLDHPDSALAHVAKPLTFLLAQQVAAFSAAVHALTRTSADRLNQSGHRAVTHTLVWAVLSGLATTAAQLWAGQFTAAALVFCMAGVGIQKMLPPGWRTVRISTGLRLRWASKRSARQILGPDGTRLVNSLRWFPLPVSVPCAVALALLTYRMSPEKAWWLGLAVGAGSLIHCLGDCLTHYACPILWPIPLGRSGVRRRWYPIGPPPAMRFTTGGMIETRLVQPLLIAVGCAAIGLILWSGTTLFLDQVADVPGGKR